MSQPLMDQTTNDTQGSVEQVVIIGSGPAGLTAAIYAGRANLSPLVIEGSQAGGQLMLTSDVENFPGFPDGVDGPELMVRLRDQAERFGARFLRDDVLAVELSTTPHVLHLRKEQIRTQTLIIASGAKSRMLGLDAETRLQNHGVSSCAVCDGFFFKDQHIVVIGGGDSALEEALFLTHFASRVTLVHRRSELRASVIMQQRVRASDKIDILFDQVVTDLIGEERLEAIVLQNTLTGTTSILPAGAMFVAIGHDPATSLFNELEQDSNGYLIIEPGSTRTSQAGVFAAGDVADPHYRQAITAAGTGAMAALDAERYLSAL